MQVDIKYQGVLMVQGKLSRNGLVSNKNDMVVHYWFILCTATYYIYLWIVVKFDM